MGIEKVIISGLTKCSKSIGHTRPSFTVSKLPEIINPNELRLCPNFKSAVGDVVRFTETTFKKPSVEKLKLMCKEFNIGKEIPVNENNGLFLEDLISRFPLKQGETANKAVEDLMVCLEDINHSAFTNKREFLNQFLEDYKALDSFITKEGTPLFKELYTKRAVIQAKYNNPERYDDIVNLYKLVKQGKAPKYTLQTLFPESEFHALPKSDMLKLLNGENYYPQLKTLSADAISKLSTGEAFSYGKEMFVKTEAGFEKLKIDKDTYEKLFPPIERYALAQGPLGNCHLMATLDALTKNPNTRIDIYRMFEQTENGVKCTIAKYKGHGIVYDFNKLECLYTENNLRGSLGHKIIEHTYAKNEYDSIKQLAEKGNYCSEVFLERHKTPIEVFDVEGDFENIADHVSALIGRLAKTVNHEWKKPYTQLVIDKAKQESLGVNIINCLTQKNKNGLFHGHFYHGNINDNTIVNPWNTMESISCNPFNLEDITYIV